MISYPIIFLVGSIQGVVLTFFLFSVKHNIIANRLLGIKTFCWAIILLVFALQFNEYHIKYPHLLITFDHVLFLVFPLYFLYLKYLISKHNRFKAVDLLHFIPFVVSVLLYANFYFKTGAEKIAVLGSHHGYYFIVNAISEGVLALQGISYSILVLYYLIKYNKRVMHYNSSVYKKLTNGILWETLILLLSWIVGSVAVVAGYFNIDVNIDLFVFVYLLIVICIYWISYIAIKSPEIFKLNSRELHTKVTYSVSSSQDLVLENLDRKFTDLINNDKPFLNPELSLQELADMLNVTRSQLSYFINKMYGKNFYELINFYRLEEVKRLMQEPKNKNLKIMSLAYDAGFNSKSSFNRIFRNHMECTPSEYMKSVY